MGRLLALPTRKGKHSSLFCPSFGDTKTKKFYNIDVSSQIIIRERINCISEPFCDLLLSQISMHQLCTLCLRVTHLCDAVSSVTVKAL